MLKKKIQSLSQYSFRNLMGCFLSERIRCLFLWKRRCGKTSQRFKLMAYMYLCNKCTVFVKAVLVSCSTKVIFDQLWCIPGCVIVKHFDMTFVICYKIRVVCISLIFICTAWWTLESRPVTYWGPVRKVKIQILLNLSYKCDNQNEDDFGSVQ